LGLAIATGAKSNESADGTHARAKRPREVMKGPC
jgi:hypothetical protein